MDDTQTFVRTKANPRDAMYERPIFVDKVHYDGVNRTKRATLDVLSKHIFKARTLGELVHRSYAVKCYMEELSLFRNVDVAIEPSKQYTNAVEVVYAGKELPRIKAMADAVLNESGQINTGVHLSSANVSGRGDSLKTSFSVGREKMSMLNVQYVRPWLCRPGSYVSFDIFRNFRLMPQCSAVAVENGVSISFFQQLANSVAYSARLLDSWRFFNTKSMNFMVREHAGHSVKVSFEHSLQLNTEDDRILPTRGTFLKVAQEFARFWGDTVFTKYQLDIRRQFPLPLGFFTSFGCSFVHVSPEFGRSLSFVDRTFLGGSTNLRGFGCNSVGSCVDDGSYIGGTGSICLTAHLFRSILHDFLYGHAFCCAGSIWHIPYTNPLTTAWQEMTAAGGRRSSVGVGLVFKFAKVARVELNYCWPVDLTDGDKAGKGLQIGVGTQFL